MMHVSVLSLLHGAGEISGSVAKSVYCPCKDLESVPRSHVRQVQDIWCCLVACTGVCIHMHIKTHIHLKKIFKPLNLLQGRRQGIIP